MKRQGGYVLFLFIPTLLTVTAMLATLQTSANSSTVLQLQILSDARQQLIAYSSSYLESYKPTGAGPGHLPCPDTDQTTNEFQVQVGLRGDGPNPPCGKHSIALGKLPRHISHSKSRYAFHLEDKHNLWYAVDTRFINNPVNRVVNPDSVGRIHLIDELPAAAMIFIPRESALLWKQTDSAIASQLMGVLEGRRDVKLLEESVSQYILITPAMLLQAVTLRVALWLQDQYQVPGLFDCASSHLCAYGALRSCDFFLRDKILLLIIKNKHVIKCDGSSVDSLRRNQHYNDARLDSVFLYRHWFYRNDWWRFVEIRLAKTCEEALADCDARVVLADDQRHLKLNVKPL